MYKGKCSEASDFKIIIKNKLVEFINVQYLSYILYKELIRN